MIAHMSVQAETCKRQASSLGTNPTSHFSSTWVFSLGIYGGGAPTIALSVRIRLRVIEPKRRLDRPGFVVLCMEGEAEDATIGGSGATSIASSARTLTHRITPLPSSKSTLQTPSSSHGSSSPSNSPSMPRSRQTNPQ